MENTKPLWLQALESQSWQAELVASGLALFGAINLGPFIDNMAEQLTVLCNDRVLNLLYYILCFIYMVHSIVVVSFIAHLSLRILWIGFLGLSSVYPNGINIESKVLSSHFLIKLKDDFPNLSSYSIKLDHFCSAIFSILCSFVLLVFTLIFWGLLFVLVSELLNKFFEARVIMYIGFGMVGLFSILLLVLGAITEGPLKESSFAKSYAYNFNRNAAKLMYLIAYTPLNYIIYTIRTNTTTSKFYLGMSGILVISAFLTIPKLAEIASYYNSDLYFRMNEKLSSADSENYLNKVKKSIILKPVIQSEVISENHLLLFIPKFKREEIYKEKLCGKFILNEVLTRRENSIKKRKFNTECANKFYKVFIDEQKINNINFYYKVHDHNREKGYQTYLPLDTLSNGFHILKVESNYQNEEGELLQRIIPFYKSS